MALPTIQSHAEAPTRLAALLGAKATVGYVALDARGSELLFQIVTEWEEKAPIATASNLPFSEWGQPTSSRPAPRPPDADRG